MRESNQQIKKKKLPILRYMISLLLLTTIVTGVSLSRYSTSLSTSNAAPVAKFSINYKITDPNSEDTISLDPSIYATCKLSDADNCDFDDIAVLRKIEVTNDSEVAVRAALSIASKMSDNQNKGIVWCVLDRIPGENKIAEAVTSKLGGVIPGTLAGLQSALEKVNQETLLNWNADADLQISNTASSKSIFIAFWAEHDLFNTTTADLANTLLDFKIMISTSQID